MKNKFGLIFILLYLVATISTVSALSGGPDYYGYIYKDNNELDGPIYDWIEISTTGTRILANTNDGTASRSMGFTFNFYGNSYSSITISANGLARFGSGFNVANQPIPTVSNPNNFIAPFWDDLTTENSPGAGDVYYKTIGVSPRKQFIIEWYNVKARYSSSSYSYSTATFEIIINQTGEIKFQYKDVDFGNTNSNNGKSATIGIENSTGRGGLQYSYNSPTLSNERAILFYRPPPDFTPPNSIDRLANTTYSQKYINWTWTDPTDTDFDRVTVYIDGIFKTNISKGIRFYNTTLNFSSLNSDTLYNISTHTVDARGNVNQTWKNHTARTAPYPSSLSISINNGDEYTNSTNVMLSLSAINAQEMSFSNDAILWGNWEPFFATKLWSLTDGDGLKAVYFKARYGTGESSSVRDTINLDTTPPNTIINLEGDQKTNGWFATPVNITFTATDSSSGVADTKYNVNNTGWTLYSGQFEVSDQGHIQVQYNSTDNVGNMEPVNNSDIYIDSIVPQIDITGVSDGVIYNTNVTPVIIITDTNLISSSITLNDIPFVSGTEITENGTYWLNVTADDIAEHTTTRNISFTIDKRPPPPPACVDDRICGFNIIIDVVP